MIDTPWWILLGGVHLKEKHKKGRETEHSSNIDTETHVPQTPGNVRFCVSTGIFTISALVVQC